MLGFGFTRGVVRLRSSGHRLAVIKRGQAVRVGCSGRSLLSMTAVSPSTAPQTETASVEDLPKGVPTFQEAISRLQKYWSEKGCVVWHPYNHEVGAGTMNPATFLRVIGPEPWSVAYDEPSVRPDDSRYGENPNRVQRHTQFQVILKPAPENCQELLLGSYQVLGIDTTAHDVRFVEDNWESPALGAWGLGWEVWLDGMEVTQFTYFQQAGGFSCDPIALEITYGLERILMSLQNKNHFKDIIFSPGLTYGDIFMQNEVEMSKYNMDEASIERNTIFFDNYEQEAIEMIEKRLPVPAYNYLLKASHTFNILDARGAIGVTERAGYFRRMRNLARDAAALWFERREELGFPLLQKKAEAPAEEQSKATQSKIWGIDKDKVDFLIEIGMEELPADDVLLAIAQLEKQLRDLFSSSGLEFDSMKMLATPRRLVSTVINLSASQKDSVEEMKGPPKRISVDEDGNLTKSALGFCKKNSVEPNNIEWREVKGQDYLFAKVEKKGRHAGDILSEALPLLVDKISFIKTMRWNSSGVSFSRPIRWLCALLDDEVVEFEYAGIKSGSSTSAIRGAGGRAPSIEINSAQDYESKIRSIGIVPGVDERRELIRSMALETAASVGGSIAEDFVALDNSSLLSEVANLVEYPKPILGSYEEKYLKLPKAVLTTVMKKHQRYFPITENNSEDLLPSFITISNGPTDDETVRLGNEAVLRARLADASFFYEKDLKKKLIDFKPLISGLSFQEKLGSMLDKSKRVENVTESIARMIGATDADVEVANSTANLFKADLATNMVVEFTSLAGEMGCHYAKMSGESEEVGEAIFETVLPRFFMDKLPRSIAGCAVAIADRMDSLVGLFAAGCAPTANTDVYALRRTAVGLVAILMDNRLPLNLREAIKVLSKVQPIKVEENIVEEVVEFVIKRLESSLLERGLRVDLVRAVISEQGESPARVQEALDELVAISSEKEFDVALEVFGRPSRLIKSKGDLITTEDIDEALFESDLEANLYKAYQDAAQHIKKNSASVSSVIQALASMEKPVDDFFENVFVMAEDEKVRANRLALCSRIASLPKGILDLSQIQ